jgi:raffinose/stachyose/melibiose transport system permease protein
VSSRREIVLTHAVLGVFSASVLLPLLAIVITSLHPPGTLLSGLELPRSIDLSSFEHAWDVGELGPHLRASVIVAVSVAAGATLLAIPAGYGLGLLGFMGDRWVLGLFLAGLAIPFEALIVPLYYDFRDVGLADTLAGLILPQLALGLSFGVFWMRAFFLAAPRELVDAARVDGAGELRILWRILAPLARPVVLTLFLLELMWAWNEFLLVLIMAQSADVATLPLGLANFQGRRATDVPSLAAASLMVAAPILLVYLWLHRHFIRGMLAGSLRV